MYDQLNWTFSIPGWYLGFNESIDVCSLACLLMQGWQATYRNSHMEMGRRAKAVVELVKARTRHESVEVADYQNGLMLLSTTGLALYDVLLFLLTPVHNVLINLIGLHYCLFHLGAQVRFASSTAISLEIGRV